MNHTIVNQALHIAKKAALEAGRKLLDGLESGFSVEEKDASQDIVTNMDLESEQIILTYIRENYPDHNILTEETPQPSTPSPYRWIVDPIDGTTNYSKKLPYFSISIALFHQEEPLVGVVHNPATGELFWAAQDQGAFLNDEPITCTATDRLEKSLLITGFYYDRGEGMRGTLSRIQKCFEKGIMGIRRFGSAALDLCYLAAGRADGFWEHELSPWDFTAGAFIAAQAGCFTGDLLGNPLKPQKSFVIACTPAIKSEFYEVLKD